jgi:UDP-N-acetylglucosamine 2-epimerase (non-hydrolysing)
MIIHLIAAARPNFMKIAPLYHALVREAWARPLIIHTGQHYDINMSGAFFKELNIPDSYVHLGVGSGTHAEQTANIMVKYEKVVMEERPDLVIVVGDVNSTMAATLAASKLGIKVAHLEAGLRSFDRTMPEEINRIVTDALADILWTPSPDADLNLIAEGVPQVKIDRVGNIMIDSLEMLRDKIEQETACSGYKYAPGEYGVVTIHRPANVDDPIALKAICDAIVEAAQRLPLIFPVHPRTRKSLEQYAFLSKLESEKRLHLTEPLSYIRFMSLLFDCRFVITDSGGIQEETTYLGIPCLTLRPNTERPITVTEGTNLLCTLGDLNNKIRSVLSENKRKECSIEYWDGKTAGRVVENIKQMKGFPL